MSDILDDVRPMFDLRGRNYIVTGGAQGIGFAATRAICEMGGNVAVLDIQQHPVDEFNALNSKFGSKTFYYRTDVTKQDSLNEGFSNALNALGTIDGCVPAAGIAIDKNFVDQTWEEFSRIQDINVRTFPDLASDQLTCLGARNFLHSTTGRQTNHQAGKQWQYCFDRISVFPYRTARI